MTRPFLPGASTLSTWPAEQSMKAGPTGGLIVTQPEAAAPVGGVGQHRRKKHDDAETESPVHHSDLLLPLMPAGPCVLRS